MKIIKIIFGRLMFILLAAIMQTGVTIAIYRWFATQATWIDTVLNILSVIIVLLIVKNSRHLSSDVVWIILIIALPIPGTLLYILLGADLLSSRTNLAIRSATAFSTPYFIQDEDVLKQMKQEHPHHKGQFEYIARTGNYPFYRNASFDYYPLGEKGFPVMLKELRKAKKFIFLEYFIIEEGQMWDSILEILKEKAAQGVDVRVLYDDFGSFFTLSASYARRLEAQGIKCMPFNRIDPYLNIILNHRDHRKIMVIDGKTAFSGGINLADEYINVKKRFGVWKDNVIRVKGEAVWSFTLMFLTHWNALRPEDDDYEYFHVRNNTERYDGYIAPYGDTPLDDLLLSQTIYTNILDQANDYCYIFTPYLIIDTDMINSLITAAKRGVDVRIITPGIPDKKIVNLITRSYYYQLIQGGVKIYEYDPGFVHSKVFVCDDMIAAVGTVNLDYRSLYLHFENGTYLYGSKKIRQITRDFSDTIRLSHEVSLAEASHNIVAEFLLSALRLFAPMM